MRIRPWQARDRQYVQDLLNLLSEDAQVAGGDAPTSVAEEDGRVIGMVTLCVFTTLTGPKAYLDHLVVAPGRRRSGVGRALLEHALEQARAAGASRVDSTASTKKEAGHAIYRSLGFEERDTSCFRISLTSTAMGAAERA